MGKACFFIGHNDAPIHIQEALSKEIEHHIMKCNVTAKALEYARAFLKSRSSYAISTK